MAAPSLLTEAEYLELEAKSEIKHEFYNGHLYALAGGTYRHSCICSASLVALSNSLKGSGCVVSGSDTMVKVASTGLMTYPDVAIVCGAVDLFNSVAVLNPVVILEVLSPSTEAYDRGRKFMHYRQIPTLAHYILVFPEEIGVDHFCRQADGSWRLASFAEAGMLSLNDLRIEIPVTALYEGVDFGEEQPLRE